VQGAKTVKLKDKLISIGGSFINPNRRVESILYGGVQEFSFIDKDWKISESAKTYNSNGKIIELDSGFIYFSYENHNTQVVNVLDNKVLVIQGNPLHRKISGSIFDPQVFRDTIFYSIDENGLEIQFVSLNDFIGEYNIETHPFLKSKPSKIDLTHSVLFDFGTILIVFSLIWGLFTFLSRRLFVSKDVRIYFMFREMELSQFEKNFFKIFISKSKSGVERVENSEVLKLFTDDLDLGTLTRRKNEYINLLNEKLKFVLKTPKNPIVSEKSSSDRRNIYYEMNLDFFYFF